MSQKRKKKSEGEAITWTKLKEVGFGLLQLGPASFYAMTLQELTIAASKRAQLLEAQSREMWEAVRWSTTILMQPHKKKGTKLTPKDLITFPWEKDSVDKKPLTREELINEIIERDGKA